MKRRREAQAPGPAQRALAVVELDPAARERALELSVALGVELLQHDGADWRARTSHRLLLLVSARGLELGASGAGRERPVRADLEAPELLHRLRHGGARGEQLARAIGLPAPRVLRVIDATAGLGRDSAVLAALGCVVTMLERHAIVAALLADAMLRARASELPGVRELATRLELRPGDARATLAAWPGEPPDAVLLDPMFPQRAGSAAVRREMRLFQFLVGDDADAPELLAAALAAARHRVVVKRPLAAPPLAGPAPSHTLSGRSTRFDVYVRSGVR